MTGRQAIYKPRRKASEEINPVGTLILTSCEKINFCSSQKKKKVKEQLKTIPDK
jgi:hypothetical protein